MVFNSCAAFVSGEDFLVVAQEQSLLRVPLDPASRGSLILQVPGQLAVGVAMDCQDQFIYWSDVISGSISRARLDGSDSDVLVKGS